MQCYLLDGLSGGPDSEAAQLIKDVFLGFQRDTVQKICPGWSHRQLAIPETVVGHVVGQLVGQFAPTTGVVGQFAPTNLPRCSSLSSSMRGASGAEDVVGRSGSLPDAPVGFDGTPGAGGDHVDPIERPTLTEAQKKAMRVGSAAKYKADHNPPEKPRTQGGKARTSATLKRGDIYDFNLYEPILKQLFGEDCLTTSSEGFLQANPDFLTAGKVVDFFHDGAGGGGWFWRAGPGDPVRFLTCYRAYLTLVGNKGGGEAPSMLRKLASRARIQAAKRIDSRDMPTVMAGFLFRYILSMSEEKPYLAPPFSKWDQLWTPENAFSMKIHYEQAATAGLVPTSPLDFLQKIDAYWGAEGGLLRLTKSQAQELLNKKLTMNEKVAKALGLST
jgi:hypothetical protein